VEHGTTVSEQRSLRGLRLFVRRDWFFAVQRDHATRPCQVRWRWIVKRIRRQPRSVWQFRSEPQFHLVVLPPGLGQAHCRGMFGFIFHFRTRTWIGHQRRIFVFGNSFCSKSNRSFCPCRSCSISEGVSISATWNVNCFGCCERTSGNFVVLSNGLPISASGGWVKGGGVVTCMVERFL